MSEEHPAALERVRAFMMIANKTTPQEIGRACHVQHNTAIKVMHFMKKEHGVRIGKEAVRDESGVIAYWRYWIDNKEELRQLEALRQELGRLRETLKGLPEDDFAARIIRFDIERIDKLLAYQREKYTKAKSCEKS